MLAGAAVGPDGAELLEATCRVAAASNRAPGSSRSPLSLSARPQLRAGGGRAPPGVLSLCVPFSANSRAEKGQNFHVSKVPILRIHTLPRCLSTSRSTCSRACSSPCAEAMSRRRRRRPKVVCPPPRARAHKLLSCRARTDETGLAARAGVGLLFMTTQDQPPQVPVPQLRVARPLACIPRVLLRNRQTTRASPGMADVHAAGTWQIVVKEVVQSGSAWRSGMVGSCCLARPVAAELPLAFDRRPFRRIGANIPRSCASGSQRDPAQASDVSSPYAGQGRRRDCQGGPDEHPEPAAVKSPRSYPRGARDVCCARLPAWLAGAS